MGFLRASDWLERKTLGLGEQREEILIREVIGVETSRQIDRDGIGELLTNGCCSDPSSFVTIKKEDDLVQAEQDGALLV